MKNPINLRQKPRELMQDIMDTDFDEDKPTPMEAIRLRCLDCCAGDKTEVKLCARNNCPLHPYRSGKTGRKRPDLAGKAIGQRDSGKN